MGEGLPVVNTGFGFIITPSKVLTLHMVLHVQKLAASLLSVYRLCKDNNCYVILDEFGFWVQDKATKKVVAMACITFLDNNSSSILSS